jgi:hypothetical protein
MMVEDAIYAEVQKRQGFLVYSSFSDRALGSIIPPGSTTDTDTALRVIGFATFDEYINQVRLIGEIIKGIIYMTPFAFSTKILR